jgi:hypothetical protein
MSYVIIILNGLLAGVFIGVIGGGKVRDGLKFAPALCIVGIILFGIMLQGIGMIVGGFV